MHRFLYLYNKGVTTQSLLLPKIGHKSPPNKYQTYYADFGNYTNWIYLNWFKLFIQFSDFILCCRNFSLSLGEFIWYLPCEYEETYVIAENPGKPLFQRFMSYCHRTLFFLGVFLKEDLLTLKHFFAVFTSSPSIESWPINFTLTWRGYIKKDRKQ